MNLIPYGTAVGLSCRRVMMEHCVVKQADMFVHSFRPGVPERLRIDYEALSALSPSLIYLYAGSYGSKGPQAARAAFHSTPNALSGIMQAGEGNPPVDDSFPDPGSALGAATALLLGLRARALTGRGQKLEITMLASTGYVMSPSLVFYDGVPSPVCVDHGQRGFDRLYRLYHCAADWLFLCCVQPSAWRSLAKALGHTTDWLQDSRFVRRANRLRHDSELAIAIGSELAKRPAAHWAESPEDAGRASSDGIGAFAGGLVRTP